MLKKLTLTFLTLTSKCPKRKLANVRAVQGGSILLNKVIVKKFFSTNWQLPRRLDANETEIPPDTYWGILLADKPCEKLKPTVRILTWRQTKQSF